MNEYDPLREEYARTAARYDTRWKHYIEASVRETLKRLVISPGNRVLDVGCGTGALLEAIATKESEARLVGIDLSKEMLGVARSRLGSDVDLREGIAEELPFEDFAFDVVVSSSMFHDVKRPEEALGEMRRVLAHSGRVVITDWCRDFATVGAADWFMRAFNSGHHFRTYSSKDLTNLMRLAGLEALESERYKVDWFWGMMTVSARRDVEGGLQP